MKYIIGNWKSNKTSKEVKEWFNQFAVKYGDIKEKNLSGVEIIVCPPFVYLEQTVRLTAKLSLPIKIGAQDISPFGNGPYTGEVSAEILSQFVDYVIIGHSERRDNFGENDKILEIKAKKARQAGIEPIFCIPGKTSFIPDNVSMVAYEPVWAIGTGKAETPENAGRIAAELKRKADITTVIYGGSVTHENVAQFYAQKYLDGVLPGGASLDPHRFFEIIKQCPKDSSADC